MEDGIKREFELASTDLIEKHESEIDELLELLGHPEALVTDESYVSDFLDIFDREAGNKVLDGVSQKLGMGIDRKESMIGIAQRLREHRLS